MAFRLSEAIATPRLEKDIFYISHSLQRACPTNGSDRGSLRSHDLTFLVLHRGPDRPGAGGAPPQRECARLQRRTGLHPALHFACAPAAARVVHRAGRGQGVLQRRHRERPGPSGGRLSTSALFEHFAELKSTIEKCTQ